MTSPDFDPSSAPGAHAQPGDLLPRFVARLIDGILVGFVAFFLSLLFFDQDLQILVTGLFSGVLTFAYFVFFEVSYGTTPGKKLLGLTVHGPGGAAKPDFRQSAIRNSFTLLAVIPYYLGSLLALIAYVVIAVTINASPSKQGKHDEWAGGTQVIKS